MLGNGEVRVFSHCAHRGALVLPGSLLPSAERSRLPQCSRMTTVTSARRTPRRRAAAAVS
jgi:hypothetical protein